VDSIGFDDEVHVRSGVRRGHMAVRARASMRGLCWEGMGNHRGMDRGEMDRG
jgi:hypothetical protein